MHPIKVEQLSKYFVPAYAAVNKVSFDAEAGEIIAIVGGSGSGKTSLLRMLAGFEHANSGEIWISDRLVAGKGHFTKPEDRSVGFVFQDLALFPHLTVEKNILFGLKKGQDKKGVLQKMLTLTGLKGLENRYPWQLSGGQQQRVAIARALAPAPAVLFMDEPFSSLDQALKQQLRSEILAILKSAGITTLMVSHDIEDAYAMASRIMVMDKGRLVQFDSPEKIYRTPVNQVVARLGGKCNFVKREELGLSADVQTYMLRPENIRLIDTKSDWQLIQTQFNGKHFENLLEKNGKQLLAHTTNQPLVSGYVGVEVKEEDRISVCND